MFKMKNILLVLHAIVLLMTLSVVILPNIWMIKMVGGADGLTGIVFPIIWMVYVVTIFVTSGLTFSWLVKHSK